MLNYQNPKTILMEEKLKECPLEWKKKQNKTTKQITGMVVDHRRILEMTEMKIRNRYTIFKNEK